jgi:hypothetical protein
MARISGTDVADPWTLGYTDASADTRWTLGSWVLTTWVGVTMVVLLPAMLVYATPAPKSAAWYLALVVTTISGARYTQIVADGRRRLYEMSFWVFTYVFLGIAPLAQLRTGETPITTPRIDTTLQQQAVVVVIVGIVAFVIGLSISGPRRNFLPGAYGAYALNGVDLGRTVVLALFALLFDAYFIAKVGIGSLFSSRDDLSRAVGSTWAESSTTALVVAITTMTLLVSFIALVKWVRLTKSREWPLIALTVLVGLALAITVNPITSARYISGTAILAVAALFGLFATPGRFRVIAILWVIALIVVFPLADAFRYSTLGEFKSSSTLESLTSPDFDAFAEINNTLLYVERHGITQGRQAVGVALFWVPRRLWPDKPLDTGVVLSDSRGYTRQNISVQNLSAPMWAEMYINGGWPLLVFGMLGLGIVVKSQDNRIEESLRRARAPSILACILPFYLTILLRGSLLQAMSYLIVILVSAMFVSRWERVSSR